MRLILIIAAIWRVRLARHRLRASMCLAELSKGLYRF
jgi:hypothetical protein